MSDAAPTIAARLSSYATTLSPYPPSFDNSAFLYGSALFSLMSIAMFGAVVAGWMARDIWRDRYHDHPFSLACLFRAMVGIAALTGFIRCLPEVAFMTCYGEVTGYWMGRILTVKRIADSLSLFTVLFWMTTLVLIYPFVIISLHSMAARHIVVVDPVSVWPRLMRPLTIVATILLIAFLMAVAKGSLGHAQ